MKGIEGSTLGRYELRLRVARGGMSEVYLGYDRRVRRRVAVKVLYGSDEPFVRRFEREALAVGTLSHDHILPLYDFGEQRPWYYLVMPFVEGGTLRDYLLKKERLTMEEAGSFLDQIAAALQYAHDHGVVHRDVKPSNILLRPDGYAYLGDFGLAKAKIEAEFSTHSGIMIGTPEYMAPEQSNGNSDYRSDIYSLGIILYQMLTGHVPFTADSPLAVSLRHIQSQPKPPREFNPTISPTIENIILKALKKNPEERYQQASELAIAYRKALLLEQARNFSHNPGIIPVMEEETVTSPAIVLHESLFPSSSTLSARQYPKQGLPHKEHLVPFITPQLYPLGNEAPAIPSLMEKQTAKRLIRLLFILLILCSIIMSATLLPGLFSHPTTKPHPQHRSTAIHVDQQKQASETAWAQISTQTTLATQARVQAEAGITEALGVGKTLYQSDMKANRIGEGWINDGHQCFFSPEGYHVATRLRHAVVWCYSDKQTYENTIITMQTQLLYGDFYGLVFRLSPRSKAFYVLEMNRKREYRFVRVLSNDPRNWLTLIDWTQIDALLPGYGQINTFLLIAEKEHFRIYINRQLIVSDISDTAYLSGYIGFLVGGDSLSGTEAVFSNLWIFQK